MKYCYIIGKDINHYLYYDSNTNNWFEDTYLSGKVYKSKIFDNIYDCIDAIIDDGYGTVDQKLNFPEHIDYLEDIKPEDIQGYIDYYCDNEDVYVTNEITIMEIT